MEENEKLGMHAGAPPWIFERATLLRETMTVEECVLWDFLKHRPLGFKFRRQHPFNLYILDFYCHRAKLSIEVDGTSHDTLEQQEHDGNRTKVIQSFGITEIRFRNEQLIHEKEAVKKSILDFLLTVKN
jgi:very-short-patch-repair endonuclease